MSETPYTNPTKAALFETLKEVARYMAGIGVLDILVGIFTMVQSMINTGTGEIHINFQMIWAFTLFSLAGAAVRALDKFKHEYGKLTEPRVGESQGILPF